MGLVVRANNSAKVEIDGETVYDGAINEDWKVLEPKEIDDPEDKKPDDWDDEEDGEWEAPMIDNPDFKGEWHVKRISNPDYKDVWAPKKIANPAYVENNEVY